MSESIYDGLPYLYAEQLQGKRVTLTIKEVKGGVDFFCPQSNSKSKGYDIKFAETPKMLGVTSATVRRQLFAATGTETPSEMVGKKIVLFPQSSKKSATGVAIRVAKPE